MPGEVRNMVYSLVLRNECPSWRPNDMGVVTVRDYSAFDNQKRLAHRQATRTSYKTVECELVDDPCISSGRC